MPSLRSRLAPAGAVAVAVALALAAGCGGGGTAAPERSATPSAPSAPTEVTTTSGAVVDRPYAGATVARSSADIPVYRDRTGGEPAMVLPATTEFGSVRTLLVEYADGDWLRVSLPLRPNGSSGWVRSGDVELRRVTVAIEIDLADRALTVRDGDAVLLTTPVAIGAEDAPTPAGTFFVVDKLDSPDGGPYGPFAIGLSGHSDTLTEFGGGDGQIGIHGTDDPSSIGGAVSHGCIRVPNDVITAMVDLVPLGTPVEIV